MTGAVARSLADVDSSQLLGFLEFHSFADLMIHKDELADIFTNKGIDMTAYDPRKISAHDVFRRATKSIESTIDVQYNGDMHKAKILVREVLSDKEIIERHVVRELIDVKNRKLAHATVASIILNREHETISISSNPQYANEHNYMGLAHKAKMTFDNWMEYHTKDTVSNLIRRMIKDLNHVSIIPNGRATFIPKTRRTKLDAIVEIIEALRPYHGTDQSAIEIIPIIDTAEQRNLVKKRVEETIDNELNELLYDFSEILANDRISPKIARRYVEKAYGLMERVEEYENLIQMKMGAIHGQIQSALEKIDHELEK